MVFNKQEIKDFTLYLAFFLRKYAQDKACHFIQGCFNQSLPNTWDISEFQSRISKGKMRSACLSFLAGIVY